MKTVCLIIGFLACHFSFAQNPAAQLDAAIKKLETDEQFRHAIVGICVVDSKTGKTVFEKNAGIGLAPASCQKVVTSVSAFELLGKNFHYNTYIGRDPAANNKFNAGSLFIIGRGDPTLGSWRWKNTMDTSIFSKIVSILRKNNINSFERSLFVDDMFYGISPLPGGWVWEDIGNYYGAACFGFNWYENQFDLVLQPGKQEGEATMIVKTVPAMDGFNITNLISTGSRGSGDNGYIYSSPFSGFAIATGTIPLQQSPFTISGSIPDPAKVFRGELTRYLQKQKITIPDTSFSDISNLLQDKPVNMPMQYIDSIPSPSLDSINYWFLKKSINLYGEAFLKSIAIKKYPHFNPENNIYDTAISIIKRFWKERGIEGSALKIIDGSGLSPANRVTTNALVTVLQYAGRQDWFPSFYAALPETNGIKMKDGYIGGVRSYTGYVKSKDGTEYTFSFIVNNFDGNPGTAREKMWKILDILK